MRLSALLVENFRQFERIHLSFAPGFTVVKGPNEAGKSTILAAILSALFLDPRTPEQALSSFIRWGQDERFRLRLEFEHDEVRYLYTKDFQARTLSLQWYQPADAAGGSVAIPDAAQAIIGRVLGMTSMEAYVNTACIRSDDMSRVPSATAPVSHRLQAKVTEGRRASAIDVIRIMEQELLDLARGGPRRLHETGALRAVRERLDALERSRSAVAAKLQTYEENQRQLGRLRHEVADLDAAIGTRTARLELSDHVQTLAEDCVLLQEHLQELQRTEVLHESIGEAAEFLSQMDHRAVAAAIGRAQGLERQLGEQKIRQAELNAELSLHMLKQLQKRTTTTRALLLMGGAAVAGVGFCIAIASLLPAVVLGAVLGALVLTLAFRIRHATPPDTAVIVGELHLCGEKIRAADQELARLLAQYKLHSVDELATVGRELRPSLEAGAREQRIAQILGSRRAESRQAAMIRVSGEIERRRAQLAEIADRRLSVEEYERLDQEIAESRALREQAQRDLYHLEGELCATEVDSEALAALDEELQVEQVRLARLERRRKVLERAISGMREALAGTLAQTSAVFRAGIARHLGPITDGRYAEVDAQIAEDALHLMVYTADRRRAVKADSLSRATQDQIYLAARMALLELACDGNQPPLILDDPFVNYDNARLENTIRLLRRLYGTYQIVLFTCTDRYDRYADQLIALDGPPLTATEDAAEQMAVS